MTLQVEWSQEGKELMCHPTVLEMREALSDCFDMIIDVASNIPSIENILFPEIQEKSNLFRVHRSERDVRIFIHGGK